jgi:tetratricopeptide (TPR) repeat protein/predicted Ser/Thr protein kinase
MTLLAKIREVLAPTLVVERELGQGGMGVVFLGRDITLDRAVAIKVLRPEIATAIATERFLLEARVLARLKHPNAVRIYQAGTSNGLLYYVMDLVTGETLASKLTRGPLDPDKTVSMGRDLLGVLEESHHLGIIHRDIKPANIFLSDGKALLGDFGIAHVDTMVSSDEQLTVQGELLGTPAYMAPEQLAREPVARSSDLYSLSLVLYESLTGRRWPPLTHPDRGNWSGVPAHLVPILKRGLALSPADRWPTASAFQRALGQRQWSLRHTIAMGGLGLALVGAAIAARSFLTEPESMGRRAGAALAIGDFATAIPADRQVAADLSALLTASLSGLTDIRVRHDGSAEPGALQVGGTLSRDGERIRVTSYVRSGESPQVQLFAGTSESLATLIDSLAYRILSHLWSRDEWWVPSQALPRSPDGLSVLVRAELSYAGGQYQAAAEGYLRAVRIDSACVLCWFRYNDVRRWLTRAANVEGAARVRANIDRFPRHYQLLIETEGAPFPKRIELLNTLVSDYPDFAEGWRRLGGELHNRGPLYGHLRSEARRSLETAVRLNPAFIPPWYDLAVLLVAQGDSAAADTVAGHFIGLPLELESQARAVLLQVAFGFRFATDPIDGLIPWHQVRANPMIATLPELPSGPRVVQGMGVPSAGVGLGRDYALMAPNSTLHLSGLVAQILGDAAQGNFDGMFQIADSLNDTFPDEVAISFAARLRAIHSIFLDSLESGLDMEALIGFAPSPDPLAGAWLLALHRVELGQAVENEIRLALAAETAPAPRRLLVEAWETAARGEISRALAMTNSLTTDTRLLEGDGYDDLFLRSAVKLSRARWFAQLGNMESARRELRWHQHFHMPHYPTAGPEVAEVDWALAALASWTIARLVDRRDAEVCIAYRTVAERWASGDSPYAARAALAERRLRELSCEAIP